MKHSRFTEYTNKDAKNRIALLFRLFITQCMDEELDFNVKVFKKYVWRHFLPVYGREFPRKEAFKMIADVLDEVFNPLWADIA